MAIGRIPEPLAGVQESLFTTKGDLVVATGPSQVVRQGVGSNNQVLMADSVQADGVKWANEATATLTAKGDILTATGANTIARLGVGANGTTLVADSAEATGLKWATPSSGGLTLLSTTTLSGTSTTISSISGSYVNLLIFIYGVNLSASNEIRLKPNNSGSITDNCGLARQDGFGTGSLGATNDDIRLDYSSGTRDVGSGNTDNFWSFLINNYASASTYKTFNGNGGYNNSGGNRIGFLEGGIFKSNTAISSLVLTAGGATFNAGTVLVYGAK